MPENGTAKEEIGDLERARVARLDADRDTPMSARLARLHARCKQMSAIKGAAAR
ncbi:MAG TPA: hypothetical protein VLK56_02625 [Solirubrobacterales bacterium]|nr:hypothetical protein [Solirubrobacterales bacterium]